MTDESPALSFDNLSDPTQLTLSNGRPNFAKFTTDEDGLVKVQFNESFVLASRVVLDIEIAAEGVEDLALTLESYGCGSGKICFFFLSQLKNLLILMRIIFGDL